jgi:spermidine synthase
MLNRVGADVTIVDIDPSSFEVARQYFHMPDEIECHVADGRAFLRKGATLYDAVVLDAFSKQVVPTHLLSPSFFALVKSRMRPRGSVFLINLIVADDDDPLPFRVARSFSSI